MEITYQASLTPEQLAAITASGGFARCEDPNTHVRYELIQVAPSAVTDEYIRQKVDEAYADVEQGNIGPWDLNDLKEKLQARLLKERNKS